MRRLCLFATLAAALLLRLPGIEWGLPPATPQVVASDFRSSYAFDEDDILSGVAKADVKRFDFDPHEYHWGTLHSELVLLALDGAQAAGVFHTPWRAAYYNLVDRDFVKVYVIGRLVAVAAALWQQRFPWRGVLAVAGGTLLGFIAGGPYVVIKPLAFYEEINRYMTANAHIPAAFTIPAGKLLGMHVLNLARFSMGLPAFLLAVAGIVWMVRRRSLFDWIVLAAIAGYTAILLPLHWPLIRYDLPLL